MTMYKWSQTASADATADSTINWAEGQAPSSVNDSARAMMAATAKYRDDITGAIVTGGTSTAYTLTSFQIFDTLAHLNGQIVAFLMNVTNAGACTLNVDGLGAKPLRSASGIELPAGTLIQNSPYTAVYNSASGEFFLHGFFGNPYNIPIGAGIEYWGTTVPNSSFAFPIGQAISRTTYSALFAIMSTTYGAGDGSTTFNLPDKTGRVSAMKEASGTRLTTAGSGVDGGTMGSAGGAQTVTLVTGNLPPYTPAGSVSVTPTFGANGTPLAIFSGGGANGHAAGANQSANLFGGAGVSLPASFTGTAAAGQISTPVNKIPPTIICNYIIRII